MRRWAPEELELGENSAESRPTSFRKVLASSVPALRTALEKRRSKLMARLTPLPTAFPARNEGNAESVALNGLIALCGETETFDPKLRVAPILYEKLVQHGGRKLLIFTESRVTQSALAEMFFRASGHRPAIVRGEQSMKERQSAIDEFKAQTDILISTEAGAEGFNLQEGCHVVISWGLPWNPMRLVQRTGRVDRIGQTHRVIAINMMVPGCYDDHIMTLASHRLSLIEEDLRSICGGMDDWAHQNVFGRPAASDQLASILSDAAGHSEVREVARIDAAITMARRHS